MADLEHVRWIRRPELRNPYVIAAFTGWNDAADAASGAVKQLHPGLILQLFYAVADRRLAQTDDIPCPAKAAGVGNGDENTKLT